MEERNRILLAIGLWLVFSIVIFYLAHFIYQV
jgi:hypothetical protein